MAGPVAPLLCAFQACAGPEGAFYSEYRIAIEGEKDNILENGIALIAGIAAFPYSGTASAEDAKTGAAGPTEPVPQPLRPQRAKDAKALPA